jgi:hypothetical protein
LFTPSQSWNITPNEKMWWGMTVNINVSGNNIWWQQEVDSLVAKINQSFINQARLFDNAGIV